MKPELAEYLKLKAQQSFDIKTNNCVQFSNECWKIYYGQYWGEEYMKLSSFEECGLANPLAAADKYLTRSEKPQEGHLVVVKVPGDTYLHGLATGFCVGDLSVFLNTKGVRYLPTKLATYSWKNKDARV